MFKTHRNGNLFNDSVPNGARIRQARELNSLTQFELAEKVGVSQGLIAHIEGSFKPASTELVHKIAVHTKRFQPSFFYSEPRIAFRADSVMFRAMASTTRSEETEARRYAEVVCEMAHLLLGHTKKLEFRLNCGSTDASDAARRTRSLLQIPTNEPIAHLLRAVEISGVLVLALPMDLPKRDALSLWSEEINMPVIALSGSRPGDRLRLSAAHELGHIVLKHSKVATSSEEQQAYEFAAELLMPESAMRREMVFPVTLSSLATLKARWRVSMQALIQRGKELGILEESRAKYLYTQISVKGWRKSEPVDIPVERPRLLRQLFERVYGQDQRSLANDLGYKPEFVSEILSCYEGKQLDERDYPTKVIALRKKG